MKKFIHILNEDETRAIIGDKNACSALMNTIEKWQTTSDWIADLLDAREKEDGYQYNASFMRWLEDFEGWEPSEENGSALSILIYTAQDYRRCRKMERSGYRQLDNEMIEEALALKKKISVHVSGVLGESDFACRAKRLNDGRLVAMIPRSRTKGFMAGSDTWAKIAA